MTASGLVTRRKLVDTEMAQVRALEEACNTAENIRVKFNWSMIQERGGAYESDYLYYEDGRLVGYAPLDFFGGPFEVTAAVLPDYRKRGIFNALFTAARRQVQDWEASEFLLVNYPGSPDGTAVVRHMGLPYRSSEYRMEASIATIPPLTESRLVLETVDASNVALLSRLLAISFGDSSWNLPKALLEEMQKPDKRYYLAKWDNVTIGQIGVIAPDHNVYIQAVGIAPEWRRNGYGRRLLSATVQKMLTEGRTHFSLDVATDNRQALSLYQSVGFHETTAYDYYTVPLGSVTRRVG